MTARVTDALAHGRHAMQPGTRPLQGTQPGATVVDNRELVDTRSPFGRSRRQVTVELDPGVTYAAGDLLEIVPCNDPLLIAGVARRFGVDEDDVWLQVGRHDLAAPATPAQVERLAAAAVQRPEQRHLATLVADAARYADEILDRRVSVLDLLTEHASCTVSLAELQEMLPLIRPRPYSISSSPLASATRCTITVAIVEPAAGLGHGVVRGTCTSYLSRVLPGERLTAAVRKPVGGFALPEAGKALLMIAAGSGVGPFRGFIEERACRVARGEQLGPAVLFFGCDHPDVDFLYRDELARWQARGLVMVLPAFSRCSEDEAIYVQHRLWKERARVAALLEAQAAVYVCGDRARMAPAAVSMLARIAGGPVRASFQNWNV